MKKLPIGLQTFNEIIKNNYIYIDKTPMALDMIENYKYVFLSRPRRFGKSLFLDTLNEIFNGEKELFKGLYIYDKWEFEKYPVIRIDWSGDFSTKEETINVANRILKENQKRLNIECEAQSPNNCIAELIQQAYEKYQKPVVILIDEYDKPILDNIKNPQMAEKNREFLRGIYSVIKANDRYIKFNFVTGITKFAKASMFSGNNQLLDISLFPKFGDVCGYTHEDVKNSFKDYLNGVDLERVKRWYNGYNFLGDKVYNPFDILQFFETKMFDNYWWASGSAFSIIEMLKNGDYYIPDLENVVLDKMKLESFELNNIPLESLLFQGGYLTIDYLEEIGEEIEYKLKVPNLEVQISLNKLFIDYLVGKSNENERKNLIKFLQKNDLEKLKDSLISLFASIPYNNYVNNTISNFEGYYASVIYAYLASLGFDLIAEDVTNKGRIDLTIKTKENIYIIEFKVGNEDALSQIKENKYHEKYLNENKNIYLIGINFDEKEKNISKFEFEKI